MRLQRVVNAATWSLPDKLGERRVRLHDVPQPFELAASVVADAESASKAGRISTAWEHCCESPGCYRVVAQVPLKEITCDQFFKGRSGYRAQDYLSPEEGILLNRELIFALLSALQHANRLQALSVAWDLIELSLRAPHSKVWIFNDKAAFDECLEETLNPPRWVKNKASTGRGRRVPLPKHLMMDVKGAFIHPRTLDLFIDELKADRACDLFTKGFS